MRSVPDGLSVFLDDHLRRLVTNAREVGKLAGNLASALHLEQVYRVLEFLHFAIGRGTDAARIAVFENNDRLVFRIRNQLIKRCSIVDLWKALSHTHTLQHQNNLTGIAILSNANHFSIDDRKLSAYCA